MYNDKDKQAATIDTFTKRAENYNKEASWISSESFISPLIPAPFGDKKLLDVCSGTGALARYANAIGWDVTATDISEAMLNKIGNGIRVCVADAENLQFPEKSFDMATCRQGLQYTDVEASIKSMCRCAKSLVSLGHITIRDEKDLDFWEKYYSKAKNGRKNVFAPHGMERTIKNMGLEISEVIVLDCFESHLNPVAHLDPELKQELKEMLLTADDEFKARNHLVIKGDDIYSERRWEMITIRI
jgi:SAM-dependent methyltransferase